MVKPNKLIILTAHRTGSTWLWIILQNLLGRTGRLVDPTISLSQFLADVSNTEIIKAIHPPFSEWDKYLDSKTDFVINITRNIYDTMYSYAMQVRHSPHEGIQQLRKDFNISESNLSDQQWARTFLDSPLAFSLITEWYKHNVTRGPNYLQISYEELHQRPVDTIKRLIKPLGGHCSKEDIIKALEASSFEQFSENRLRGQERPEHHFRKGVIGDGQVIYNDKESKHKISLLLKQVADSYRNH